jgi:hypothetical protein
MRTLILAALAAAISPALLAQSPPATTISEAGALIVSTAFDQDTPLIRKKPILGWKAGIGHWQVKDGALHGDEVEEDHHHSSCTWQLEAKDLIFTAQFRLGTAKEIAFGCRDNVPPHHHLARTYVNEKKIYVVHQSGIGKTTKSAKLAEKAVTLNPAAWHSIVIEIVGDHYRATVDGQLVEAHHARYLDAKGLAVLITKGQGAQFKNVAVWHAKPKARQ